VFDCPYLPTIHQSCGRRREWRHLFIDMGMGMGSMVSPPLAVQADGVEASPDSAKHRHAEVVVVEAAVDIAIGSYALCNCAGMIGELTVEKFAVAVKETLNASGIRTWRKWWGDQVGSTAASRQKHWDRC